MPLKRKAKLFVCGPMQLILADGVDATPKGRKSKGIIALIVLAEKPSRSRAWLQDKLWSESAAQQAAASLRQELSSLKKHLNDFDLDFLHIGREVVSIDLEAVGVDIFEKNTLLPRSDLLEGMDINDPEFEEWLSVERQRYWGRFHEISDGMQIQESDAGTPISHQRDIRIGREDSSTRLSEIRPDRIPVMIEPFRVATQGGRAELFSSAIHEELLFLLGIFSDRIELRDSRRFSEGVEGYLITGSIIEADGIRVSSQLLYSNDNSCVWTDRVKFDRNTNFDAVERVAVKLVERFQLNLQDGAWSQIWSSRSTSIEAWEAFQRARIQEARTTKDGILHAIKLYQKCLEIDPEYLPADVAIGFCLLDGIRLGWSKDALRDVERVRRISEKVRRLEARDPYCMALSAFLKNVEGETEKACRIMAEIIDVFPHSPELLGYHAGLLGYNDNLDGEIAYCRKAMTLTPHPAYWIEANLALALALLGEKTAWYHANHIIDTDPLNVRARIVLCFLAHQSGNLDFSKRVANEIKDLQPDFVAAQWAYPPSFRNEAHYRTVCEALTSAGL